MRNVKKTRKKRKRKSGMKFKKKPMKKTNRNK